MSEQVEEQTRNPHLDEYNINLKKKIAEHEIAAKSFIPQQYHLLRAAGFSATAAGDRLTLDLSEIWSERTIRRYKPIEARHLEKSHEKKDTSKPYYEQDTTTREQVEDYDGEDGEDLAKKLEESDKHVSETLPPITRKCPACNAVIAISDQGYELSIYK